MSKKILVVDDSKVVLTALSMKLAGAGYEILQAEDGSEAVHLAREHRPDLIVLDIGLPHDVGFDGGVAWDGFLVMNWLRRLDQRWSVPVIVITGSQDPKMLERAEREGASAFFQKPVDADELVLTAQQLLGEVPA